MNNSEVTNIAISTISIIIALVALFQTKRQISLSSKQQLFDRRLSCYFKFNAICSLYTANKLYLKDEKTFCYINDLIFSWLTNYNEFKEMTLAVSNPLQHKEQKILLTKYEQLKNTAVEISMIFDGDSAEIAGEFVSSFADLLKAMYQQQVYISKRKERDVRDRTLNDYEKECKEAAEILGLFELQRKLDKLYSEIAHKKVIDKMKGSLRLTKVKRGVLSCILKRVSFKQD